MMDGTSKLDTLLAGGLVAVIRSDQPERLVRVAQALQAGGVPSLEITFTVPKAARVLEQVADAVGDQVLVGAGTVLDAETARIAILAGAEYIVSPTVSLPVIETCRRYSKLALPGALTPTEVLTAWQAGADVVKVFPSELTGPSYLKALRGPLPQVRLMPTGGVTLANAADYLRAGACALGVGGSLVSPPLIAAEDWQGLTDLARQFVDVVQRTRDELAG